MTDSNHTVTFLSGFTPLVKKFTKDDVIPYPNVKKVTSSEYQLPLTTDGLEKMYEVYQVQGERGACRLKGQVTRQLEKESRRGAVNKSAPTHSIVLDFDGLRLKDLTVLPPYSNEDVREIASYLAKLLPEPFANTSYIAHASASLGMKPGKTSMHLEFLLDEGMDPKMQKNLLRYINLTSEVLNDNLGLSATETALTWPLDICTADNSRLIFIGLPQFDGVKDPIPNSEDRIQLIAQSKPTVSTRELMDWLNLDDLRNRTSKAEAALRKARGITTKRKGKTKKLNLNGSTATVVTNPPELDMELHEDYGEYVTYNINNGDSHAYYVQKNNPTVVWNWKGEPPFLFQRANETVYQEHMEKFGITGDGPQVPFAFRDRITDTHYSGMLDPATKEISDVYKTAKINIPDFFEDHGNAAPEPIPQMKYLFEPNNPTPIDWGQRKINRWVEPDMLKLEPLENPPEFGDLLEWIKENVPTVYYVLYSLTGYAEYETKCLINWLAYILQRREKTKTAWVFQGVEGTGKGVFYSKILKPLLGQYAMEKRLETLEDDFSEWMQSTLVCAVDEFRAEDSKNTNRLLEKLRNLITEDEMPLRVMRTDPMQVPSYLNFVFFTNSYDAMQITTTDRRYNICPRQETKLHAWIPDIAERIEKQLPEELPVLVQMLNGYKVDVHSARTAINNDAKEELREAARTTFDSFTEGLRSGDIREFLEVLDQRPEITAHDRQMLLAAQNTVRGWIREMYAESEKGNDYPMTFIDPIELEPLYRILVGPINGTRKMIQALKRKGLHITQPKSTNRRRVFAVNWVPPENYSWKGLFEEYLQTDSSVAPFVRNQKENDS